MKFGLRSCFSKCRTLSLLGMIDFLIFCYRSILDCERVFKLLLTGLEAALGEELGPLNALVDEFHSSLDAGTKAWLPEHFLEPNSSCRVLVSALLLFMRKLYCLLHISFG